MTQYEVYRANSATQDSYHPGVLPFLQAMQEVIVGQEELTKAFLIALLTGEHLLIEGVPGLAKTLASKTFAQLLNLSYERIQFTPDLLPSDILGSRIFNQRENKFEIIIGPIYANVVLADEINRAPQKVHSALLQAMAERQITIARNTIPLPDPFIVIATQNPLESEGVYPLPEALLDRFLLKIILPYPHLGEEIAIAKRALQLRDQPTSLSPVLNKDAVDRLRAGTRNVAIPESIVEYAASIVHATRTTQADERQGRYYIRHGAGPRGTIGLLQAARAHAFIHNRNIVTPNDVYSVAIPVLRHRLILSFEAIAAGITPDQLIIAALMKVPRPTTIK